MILIDCPGCKEKFEAEAIDDANLLVCPFCSQNIPLSHSHETVVTSSVSEKSNIMKTKKSGNKSDLIKLDGFKIQKELGRGGMGVVFKAIQKSLKRPVAIKLLLTHMAHNAEFVARFTKEALALANLNHPNIVQIIDKREENGLYFFIMEYVEGVTLRKILKRRILSIEDITNYMKGIVSGINYAHDRNIVHRDIKPDNIIICRDGTVKIADFGLANILETSNADIKITSANMAMGTFDYMAPEQRKDSASVDTRADIYSLGVMFYEMLTSKLPLGRNFALPGEINKYVPESYDSICLKMLEPEPKKRLQGLKPLLDILNSKKIGRCIVCSKTVINKDKHYFCKICNQIVCNKCCYTKFKCCKNCFREYLKGKSGQHKIPPALKNLNNTTNTTKISHVRNTNSISAVRPGVSQIVDQSAKAANMVKYLCSKNMVLIKSGEYIMGSNDGEPEEKPPHAVYLENFYICRYAVTNFEYQLFISKTNRKRPKFLDDPKFNNPLAPICGVNFNDALAFCKWLSKMTGKHYRLPTEAEWEKAAKGGMNLTYATIDGSIYYDLANYSSKKTVPVDKFDPNSYGLYNMSGNVKEWVTDWYDKNYYHKRERFDPLGPTSEEVKRAISSKSMIMASGFDSEETLMTKCLRGGSWADEDFDLTTSKRFNKVPAFSDNTIGFRIVCDP